MFRRFRIVVLLYILILVGGGAWLTRTDSTDWQEPLWVLVYPINTDHSNAADTYIEILNGNTSVPSSNSSGGKARPMALSSIDL